MESPAPEPKQEELELGRQIALVGREHFVREFRKSIGKSAGAQSAAQAYQSRQNDSTPARENAGSSPLSRSGQGCLQRIAVGWTNPSYRDGSNRVGAHDRT